MEPFPVICETCQARLKVRDPAAVGQIHACPKCESMVHIVPPAAVAGQSASQPTAEAPTTEPPAGGEAAGATGSTTSESAPTLEEFSTAGLELDAVAAHDVSAGQPVANASESSLPELNVAGPQEVFWKNIALGSAIGSVGIFLLGGLAGVLWMRGSADPPAADPPVASRSTPAPDDADDVDEPAPVDENDDEGEENVGPIPSPEHDLPTATVGVPAEPSSATRSDESSTASPPAELPPLEPEAADAEPAATPVDDQPEEQPSAENDDRDRQEIDLLSFDPAHLDLALGVRSGAAPPPPANNQQDDRHVASFEPVAKPPGNQLPQSAGTDSQPAADTALEFDPAEVLASDEAAEPDFDPRAPVRRGPVGDHLQQRVNVDEQLATPVGPLEVSDTPLSVWLETMSGMLAVPVTLEPTALKMGGVAADQPVSLAIEESTLGEVLQQGLSKVRLDFEQRNGQLVVHRAGMDRQRAQSYGVGDLTHDGDSDARSVADLIESFIAPGSWQSAGGTGTIEVSGDSLRIQHQQGVHLDVLVLLERMLLARDLPTKTRYPQSRLSIDPTYGQVLSELAAPATFTFLSWARLDDVFRYWDRNLELTVLVDWQALADVELAPASKIACSATGRPWSESLDTILEPLGLAWRAVDRGTIQITSRAVADSQQTIEFYPVADLVRRSFSGADALIEALEQVAENPAAASKFHYDSGSGYLLVLATGDVHRQLTRKLASM